MTASGRTIQLTIYSGAGLGGSQLFQQNFQLSDNNNNSNVTLVLDNTTSPLLNGDPIYTMAFQDITPGGTATGNIYFLWYSNQCYIYCI